MIFHHFSILFIYLVGVHEVLPHDISGRSNRGDRVQKRLGHPHGEHRILLSQRLTGTDTRIEMPAYRLADGKLEETYQQRYKQKHRYARYLGMEHVANRFAHQYREVETPHIKA